MHHTRASDPSAASQPPADPRRVGRCILFGELARGGMATVHLGRWLGGGGFQRTVAVKALHAQLAADQSFRETFIHEARIVARIRHPNVVPIVDLVEERGELYIVMEYVEGVTLAHLWAEARRRKQSIPAGVVKRILSGVLHGLHAAHEATNEKGLRLGVIHRDVSPDNVLVGVDGYARLIDFGIARALGSYSATQVGWIKGKPSYLAPEQVTSQKLDHRTDIWGAAVVLWQALCGKRLFRGSSPAELVHKILTQPITPPSALAMDVGGDVDAVVLRGLARDRLARFDSAEQMAEALEATGGLASYRTVGAWVESAAGPRLKKTRALVSHVELSPLPEGLDPEMRISAAPLPPHVAVAPTIHDEASRTELTSHADARASLHPVSWRRAPIAIAVALAVAGAATAVYQTRDDPSEPTVAVSAPIRVESAPPPARSAPPPASASSKPAPPVRVSPPPAKAAPLRRPWRRDPRLPTDI